MDEVQEIHDTIYAQNGPCCAGCDFWKPINSVAGECRRSAPVAAKERYAMFGIEGLSKDVGAGHIMTPRHHMCGGFKDNFDWGSLPLVYLKRIGMGGQHEPR